LFMMWMFGTLRSLIWQRKGRVFLLALLALGVAYSSIYMPGPGDAISPVKNRVSEMRDIQLEDFTLNVKKERIFQSLHQRLLMWDTSKEIFLSKPVLGSGVGNYQMAFAQNQPKTLVKYPELRNLKTTTNAPHNEILFQLAQGGMVGVGLFLFMFMVLFLEVKDFAAHKKEGDKKQLLQAIFCGILGMLVDNMLNISLHAVVPAFIFWWLVGAEVSGVGKEESKVSIAANPATKAVALTLLACCVAVLVWQGVWFASEYESFAGQKKIAAKNYDGAVRNLSAALTLYPANTEAGFRLGQVLLIQQDYKKALAVFEKTLAAASYYEEVYYQAALAALGTGETKKAVHYLMDNLRLHPYHLQAHKLLSTLLYQNTIYAGEEELAMLEKGLTLFPYESVLWKQLGEIYQKPGENERAQNVYLRGLETDTLSKELLTRLEKMYPSTAERPPLLAQARTLQSYQDKAAKFDKMSTLYQHKLREDIEKYVMQYPQDMNGHILLARVLSLSGNDLKSEEQLRQVLRQRPDNLWANLALSSLYYQAEDLDGARRALENALFYYPDNATALTRLEKLNKTREK
ncbi:MAG: tetratricopeptide repeat protein, partial [Elusimicrobiaceae bacterium]|nr:tetratricopeptide repeat protein [Elusimicrobiaceae bacterium]